MIRFDLEDRMTSNNQPIAWFITWTVYGTFLQGDARWWRKRGRSRPPQPLLEQWHRDRLNHDVILLDDNYRRIVEDEITKHCVLRGWRLWIANARTTHVHVVVTAANHSGRQVRDQLKANCTRALREQWEFFTDRPVWTVGGDWKRVNSEEDLEQVMIYVGGAQDRMGREK
jgi:REP element-mobilizing transposase RayT